jgi:hypothetical protein
MTKETIQLADETILSLSDSIFTSMWQIHQTMGNKSYSNKHEQIADALKLGKHAECIEAARQLRIKLSELRDMVKEN